MEVSLPRQSIPENFNDPAALAKELEHFQEGHYTWRQCDYILRERERLKQIITIDPALHPIREELHARIMTSDYVRNTLEQLAILLFEYKDRRQKLEELDNMLEMANTKIKELMNCPRRTRCWFLKRFLFWRKFSKRRDLFKEMEELHRLYERAESQVHKIQDDLIFRAFCKYEDIMAHVLARNNITGVDGVLRRYLADFITIPISFTILQSRSTELNMYTISYNFQPLVRRFYKDSREDAEYVIPGLVLYGSLFILFKTIVGQVIFRKPILMY